MNLFSLKNTLLFLSIFSLVYCSGKKDNSKKRLPEDAIKPKLDYVRIASPSSQSTFNIGQSVKFEIQRLEKFEFDSVIIQIDKIKTVLSISPGQNIMQSIVLPVHKTGKTLLKIKSYINDSILETDYLELIALSDIEPDKMTYKILKTHAHQIDAYTQGLVYEDGLIYEGTGSWGKSRILKYKVGDMDDPIRQIHISSELWGEGLEIFNDKMIQLTYRAQKGFIYDKETFEKIREFNYPYHEGWGITYNGEYLIMSDGSYNLYFLDTEFLTEVKRIEVYDNKGFVDNLNELEFVDGLIYANIFMTDEIICVDPETGKVLKHIDMSNLLSPSDKHENINVFNGIAYNEDTETFYVTGKNWPKMFEVKFVKK